MSLKLLGTCGYCGGAVTCRLDGGERSMCGLPPATCERCGSMPVEPYGKIIPMNPPSVGWKEFEKKKRRWGKP